MIPLLESIVTVLIVTILGWGLMRFRVVSQDQWNGFERVSYQVFFPALIIQALAKADLGAVPAFAFGLSFLGSVVCVGGALLALRPRLNAALGMGDPAFSSVVQGAIRWNTFMAVGIAGLLHGPRGLTLTAVAIVAIVPLMNIFSVALLNRFGAGGTRGNLNPLAMLRNPFVWSSLAGLAINAVSLPIPGPAMAALDMCAKPALAAALLLVGSGLNLRDLGRPDGPLLTSAAIKLLVTPTVAALLGMAMGVSGGDLAVLLICASCPTAGAAYVMARQMGGDARLMAAIITFETIACALTIPLIQWIWVR